jgi:hypothetical protein
VRRDVELDVGEPEQVRARAAAPQQRAQARPQLLKRERLGQVVVGAASAVLPSAAVDTA